MDNLDTTLTHHGFVHYQEGLLHVSVAADEQNIRRLLALADCLRHGALYKEYITCT